jgi:hypothetical protein
MSARICALGAALLLLAGCVQSERFLVSADKAAPADEIVPLPLETVCMNFCQQLKKQGMTPIVTNEKDQVRIEIQTKDSATPTLAYVLKRADTPEERRTLVRPVSELKPDKR